MEDSWLSSNIIDSYNVKRVHLATGQLGERVRFAAELDEATTKLCETLSRTESKTKMLFVVTVVPQICSYMLPKVTALLTKIGLLL